MIDEYAYQMARRRMFSSWFGDLRLAVAFTGGAVLLVTNIVGLVLLFMHHG